MCDVIIRVQAELADSKVLLASSLRELRERRLDDLTFVSVTPSFELWPNRLSDDQYRAVIWQDMADEFSGRNTF